MKALASILKRWAARQGWGLSACRRERLAGGTLSINSNPGNGTRIDLRVPLLEASHRPSSSDIVAVSDLKAVGEKLAAYARPQSQPKLKLVK